MIWALSIAAVVGLAACSSSEPDTDLETTAAAAAPADAGADASADAGTESDRDADVGSDVDASPAPEASVDSVVATLPEGRGTVDVAVRSLVLDENGTTMTLRVDFTPHLSEPDDGMTLSQINDFFFISPDLLDREHLKRYSVITGEGSQDWLTNQDARTDDGETLSSWFVYAAPEDDVEAFTLTMDGWGLEIPDVEVSG